MKGHRRGSSNIGAAEEGSAQPEDPSVSAELLAALRDSRDDCERLRQIPLPVVERLAEANLLQLYLPRALGGPELPPLTAFRAIEAVSIVDGSAGWCAMIASILAARLAWLAPQVARTMVGTPADARIAGSIRPQGKARAVGGDYRISGTWDFASGISHARWLMCPCVLQEGGKPVIGPSGLPAIRTFWVSIDDVTVRDTWHVMGLRGTASQDFVVDDILVPAARSASFAEPPQHDGLLHDIRLNLTWAWTGTVAHSLGVARGAMQTFREIAGAKASTMSTALLSDRPAVQASVGRAEAIVSAARAYVLDTVGTLWQQAREGRGDLDAPLIQARLAITHGMHEAVRAVDILYHAAGTNAVYAVNGIERHFRDIHVALQHGAALQQHFEAGGKALLGGKPTDPGW